MNDLNIPLPNPIDQDRLSQMRAAAGPGPVLILTHDNPDPDALSSGKALATLLQSNWGISVRLVYSGLVARAENKAMLRLLTPEWEYMETLTGLEAYSALALVDTQPTAGNNSLPDEVLPQIVIDHHRPVRQRLEAVPYVDVRPDAGATVSMVYQYLDAAGIKPDPVLATAVFYGIQADTRGLSRGESQADRAVYFELLSLIDRELLNQVVQAGLSREYFQAFSDGLEAARLYGRVVVSYLGSMHRPDFGAEMADLLIRLENARAVLCLGYHGGFMHVSLRSAPMEPDAGILIQRIILPPGRAGGHGMTAGGQVPLSTLAADVVATEVQRRFLEVMGETGDGEPLLL